MAAPAGHARLATLLLVCVTAVWGSTFFLIHDLVEHVPPADFLAVRFGIAAVVMFVLFRRQTLALTRRELRVGVVLGVLYGVAQVLQTTGLAAHRRVGVGLHHRHLRRAHPGARRRAAARPHRQGHLVRRGPGHAWGWRCCRCRASRSASARR